MRTSNTPKNASIRRLIRSDMGALTAVSIVCRSQEPVARSQKKRDAHLLAPGFWLLAPLLLLRDGLYAGAFDLKDAHDKAVFLLFLDFEFPFDVDFIREKADRFALGAIDDDR